jgi:hypothetical protein
MSISKKTLLTWVRSLTDNSRIGGLPEDGYEDKKDEPVRAISICGACGRDDKVGTDPDNGMCRYCGKDNWVELSDFTIHGDPVPMHFDYISTAAKNLGLSLKALWEKIKALNTQGVL